MGLRLLDETNRRLIALLESNPNLTPADLSRKLNMAQSTITARLDKLSKAKILNFGYGVSFAEIGLQMAQVNIKTSRPDLVLEWAGKCPLFVNGAKSVAGNNLSLIFVAEDQEGFHELIDEHLLKIEGLINFDFSSILSWVKGVDVPLDLSLLRTKEPPCGMANFCLKCPANPKYSGKIWPLTRKETMMDSEISPNEIIP